MSRTNSSLPDLSGTVALITGGDGGIGSGLVRRFAEAGASVVIHHLSDNAQARDLAAEIESAGGSAATARGDIRDLDQCRAIVAAAVEAFGRLDALVNNAGVQPLQALQTMSVADWEAVVAVNLTGTFAMTRAAAEVMVTHGGGSVTHIASVEASLPAPNHAHYAASKAAVKMHARAAALELGPHGIRVNSVSPGLIDRGNLAAEWPLGHETWLRAAPLRRTGTPQDIADACIFLASRMASWVSGHDLVVDGAMSTVPAWGW
jgi:NAD(P)-dependent dehydrogenase (short-subunit alcohol dehydrogenase family)